MTVTNANCEVKLSIRDTFTPLKLKRLLWKNDYLFVLCIASIPIDDWQPWVSIIDAEYCCKVFSTFASIILEGIFLSIADDNFSLLQKINKNEIVWNPNIIAFDKWQWYIEFMKQIPKRIINDPTEGWMGAIEMFWELIHFPNTYHFSYLNFPRRKNFAFIT